MNVKLIVVSDSTEFASKIEKLFTNQSTTISPNKSAPIVVPGNSCPKCSNGKILLSKYHDHSYYCSNYKDKKCDWRYKEDNNN